MNDDLPKKQESIPTSALYGVAIIQALICLVGWFMFGSHGLSWLLWVILMGSVGIYIGLGIFARKAPFTAACIGTVLFASYLSYQWLQGVPWSAAPIYRLPVACLLLIALFKGWQEQQAKARS
jgi:hypothetical protein